jgi:Cu(I)/Ag(I) efflux system membrane fusion protein
MKKISLILSLLIITFSTSVWAAEQYTCPMHPHYISDHEGTCPICGMDLVPVGGEETQSEETPTSSTEKKILYWVAPMDSNYRRDKPGKSPMGMDLVPVYEESASGENAPGTVTISPETIQTMGVRTVRAEIAPFGSQVRAVGVIEADQRAQQELTTRVEGWIEDLKIEAVGDVVAKGDIFYRLYSPELISAQKDYISALSTGIKGRINATRKRLEFLGAQPSVIAAITKRKTAIEKLPVYAENNGTVSQIMAREGSYMKPGEMIAQIEDYSKVWVEASVAEQDMPFIASDATAEVSFPNLNEKSYSAEVDYIYPTVDTNTRIGKVRLLLPNESGALRPGLFADVVFESELKQRLAVPTESILYDSEGAHVIMALGDGKFAPQNIKTGISSGGKTEVVSGLEAGANIVVSSQFLIDSESSLKESLNKMRSPKPDTSGEANMKDMDGESMQMEGNHVGH